MTTTRTIEATTHGRFLIEPPATRDPPLVVVGFHGYAEDAEAQLARLRSIPGSDRFVLLSVQGLHRFYRGRTQDVIASWMTGQDREIAIADNLRYVAAVVDQVAGEWRTAGKIVFAGFSQGVAMAFRAACAAKQAVGGVIALGGDVPPEIGRSLLARLPATLLGRGTRDEWYSTDMFEADASRLRAAGADVRQFAFDAGHEWTPEFNAAAGAFLTSLTR